MSACSRCGAEFHCAVTDATAGTATEQCWCMALPPLATTLLKEDGNLQGCLCRACLIQLRAETS